MQYLWDQTAMHKHYWCIYNHYGDRQFSEVDVDQTWRLPYILYTLQNMMQNVAGRFRNCLVKPQRRCNFNRILLWSDAWDVTSPENYVEITSSLGFHQTIYRSSGSISYHFMQCEVVAGEKEKRGYPSCLAGFKLRLMTDCADCSSVLMALLL